MASEKLRSDDRVLAFIDLGTNSIRMSVVRIKANQAYTILREEKEIVRLGEHVFGSDYLQTKVMQKAVLVCQKFVEVANAFNSDEIIAVATSATREAKNKFEFIEELRKTGLDVKVISGKEEARLIYLGIASGVHIENKKTIFIDIGGGSTEIIIGDQPQESSSWIAHGLPAEKWEKPPIRKDVCQGNEPCAAEHHRWNQSMPRKYCRVSRTAAF